MNLLRKWLGPRQRGTPIRRRPSSRPALELLEERCAPAVLTVNSLADTTSAGSSLTLREAIMVVDGTLGRTLNATEQAQVTGKLGSNDTIQFSLPSGPQTITLTGGTLSITKPVVIVGPGAGSLTISGNNATRDFYLGSGFSQNLSLVVSMSGLTISGGNQQYGAGLFSSATLTMNNITFSNNTATNNGGGGLYNNGALTLNNCTFINNTTLPNNDGATAGGGLLSTTASQAIVTNCTFTGNTAGGTGSLAGSGGAIANSGAMTITNCTVSGNNSASDGGGIYSDGTLTVTGDTFANNVALSDGGAIRAGGPLTVNACTFTGNFAASAGGAFDSSGTALSVINSTFATNTAVSQGGAIYTESDSGSTALTNCTITANRVTVGTSGQFGGGIYVSVPMTLQNTIIAGNFQGAAPSTTANDIYGSIASASSYNLIGTGGAGGLTNGVNGNHVGIASPGLGTLANNGGPTQTVALLSGSPAIGHGSNAYVTAGETDQRGLPRVVNGTVDIGAFEVQTITPTMFVVTGFPSSGQAGAAGTITVTAETASGSVVTNYTGTVHFTSSDPQALLPADYTFVSGDNGVHTFSVTLKTAGSQTVTATDTASVSLTGAQSGIVVTPAAASTFAVAGFPSPTFAGVASSFTVTAYDAFGNIASGYRGTVAFTSTDPQAVLPASYTFAPGDNGAHTFSATFQTTGIQTLSATDQSVATITGAQSGITVTLNSIVPTLTVNSTADTTTPDNFLTLREAIELVDGTLSRALTAGEQAQVSGPPLGANDVIQFSLPAGPQTITLTAGALDITQPVTINGPSAGNLTINGNNLGSVFYVGSSFTQTLSLVVSISGLTITNGNQQYGAGLFNAGTLTVSNTTFSNNIATSNGGGGIYNNGALTLNNCTFTNNTTLPGTSGSTAGGGLLNTAAGTVAVNGCTFTGNTAPGTGASAGSGGAISDSGAMTIANSTFTGNFAASDGGAIYGTGALTVTNSTFANNVVDADGGALRIGGTNLTLIGCTFTGNTASSEGGGVDATFSWAVTITNSTFTNNTAGSYGGALRFDGTNLYLTNDTLTGNFVTADSFGGAVYDPYAIFAFNTIIAGNFQGTAPSTTPNDFYGALDPSSAYNLIGTGGSGGLVNGVNGNQVGVTNLSLGALANNGGPTQTIALLPGSPAIAAGSTAYVTPGETDQRGLPRVVNGTVDIGAFEVQAPPASAFMIAASSSALQAGTAVTITVTALSATATVASGYMGTVHFTSSDPQAVLPADYTFVTGDNGVHTFTITLKTAGAQSITATDTLIPSLTATQSALAVTPAAASTFTVAGFQNPTTAGVAGTFTVTALDAFGNIAAGYLGAVHFTSSDPQAVLPADYTFVAADNGVHTFSATLKTVGNQTLTATDTTTGVTGVHTAIGVNPASASTLVLTGFPAPTTAGAAGTFTVTAKDPFGNKATGYLGTITFTSSDARAILPAAYTFVSGDNGAHTFSATFKAAGTQTLTATDNAVATLTGTEGGITITPAAFSTFAVAGFPSPTTAGVAGAFTVTALDSLGNIVAGYRGTVRFTSTDAQATLPASYTFIAGDNGVHTFTATLKTAGSESIAAIDTSTGAAGVHPAIIVNPASASTLSVAGFPTPTQMGAAGSFTVTAKDAFGNIATGYLGSVHFTSSDSKAVLPADYTFVTGDRGVHAFSATWQTAGIQTLTATDKTSASITGTLSGITVNSPVPTLTVNSTADSTAANNFLTLREAIEIVDGTLGRTLTAGEQAQISGPIGANDVIQFNLPAGPQTITLTGGALDITKAVTINGPGAANLTINGNNKDRVLIVGQAWSPNLSLVASISGLTIAGGNQTYGAGLLNFGALTVTNTTFANNTAGTSGGGGLYNVGALTLNSCVFTGNVVTASSAGGGIENYTSATATINNCTFTGNVAGGSGGSACSGAAIGNAGAMTITGTTFTSNTAASDAGAIYTTGRLTVSTSTFANNSGGSDGGAIHSSGTLTVSACTFSGNSSASAGGALYTTDTAASVTNSTFANNTAVSKGGAIFANAKNAVFTNCTITANRALSSSSGVGGGLLAQGSATLHNTIVAGNFRGAAPGATADDIGGAISSASSFNLIGIGGAGGLANGVNNNQVGVANPGLGALANNGGPTLTIALLAGSPAIDHGSNTFVVAGETDQRGLARIVNGIVDIGAFESQ